MSAPTYEQLKQRVENLEQEILRAPRDGGEIFRAIGHPVFILDPHYTVLMANPAAERVLGHSQLKLREKNATKSFMD